MFEVPYGQDPYSAIGRYIRENITTIEDIIAVIDINGVETNELFMVDMEEDGFFIWKSDWYEGEKKVVLIDFFPVSEAINSSAQPDVLDTNVGDLISRQQVIDAIDGIDCSDGVGLSALKCEVVDDAVATIKALSSAPPEQKKGKWERVYLDHVASGERPSIFYCSSCNQCVPFPTNFCPACGSDNRQS